MTAVPRGPDRAETSSGTVTTRFTHPYVAATVRGGWAKQGSRGRRLALLVGYRLRCRAAEPRRR